MLFGIARPPPPVGSGKFGTPSARMQAAYLTAAATPAVCAVVGDLTDDPQPAIARHAAAAASRA
jgi:hypothetical protein